MPTDAVQLLELPLLLAAWVELPVLALVALLLLLLLLPQPAATSAVMAMAARLMRTFIGARTPPLMVLDSVSFTRTRPAAFPGMPGCRPGSTRPPPIRPAGIPRRDASRPRRCSPGSAPSAPAAR